MPDTSTDIFIPDTDREVLECVRQHHGLPSIDATVEWLVKRRLRRTARHINGRGRALYLVRSKTTCGS
ncbi:UBA domain-containing protein [Mycetohabitans endofungorum]|uniref:hypothetical protein n=1 Tax=Mycetohabitans endofungorum TaxID=417203 RepID=UPI002B061BA6|nr:hypothetical protein [Mycetohabitans endofungorum]